jgi:hypothetical protein
MFTQLGPLERATPAILCVILHRQNHLERTWCPEAYNSLLLRSQNLHENMTSYESAFLNMKWTS